jgi:hypothetical protein
VVGEFGGHGMPVQGHLWSENSPNWGYGGLPKDLDEWKERYARSIRLLADLRKRGVAGGVYTQTTDVEVEINGVLTYDRIPKIPAEWLRSHSDMLLSTPDVVKTTTLLPTSEQSAQAWRYRTETPAAGWEQADFDDSSWSAGQGGFGAHRNETLHVGTGWTSPQIWLRRTFEIGNIPAGRLVLRMFHDEDATVFLNGRPIAAAKGFSTHYVDFPIEDPSLLRIGQNTLAIHCRQSEGCQFIDAGILVETPAE